jgi:hypothetical protein
MENLMVIWVEVIAPEKPLDVNTSSKNIVHVDSIICKRPKISSVLIWSVAIAKNTYVDLGLSVRTKNNYPRLNPCCTLALSLLSLSLPPSRNISLSLSVCSVYDSPVMISHKKHMMFLYIISVWLTIKVCGRIWCFTYTFDTIIFMHFLLPEVNWQLV